MSVKPFRVCSHASCQELTKDRFCSAHADQHKKEVAARRQGHDRLRGSSNARGYTYKWAKARAAYLKANPFCVHCKQASGVMVLASIVDHIVPHKGDEGLFWNRNNWQSLCKHHHDVKTAKEDGGFGHRSTGRGG